MRRAQLHQLNSVFGHATQTFGASHISQIDGQCRCTGHTLKFTESNMRSSRRVSGLMDSSGMLSSSSAEM